MRGPVVAIQAIHHAMLSLVQLLLSWHGITGNEFGGLPLIVGVVNGGNRLPLGVGGNVADTSRVSEMVPVDSAHSLTITSSHLQHHNVCLRCVFFIFRVAGANQ